jgi:S-ribosylhomocysteine lyase
MKQIASFTIDHLKLLRGVYVSRKDKIGNETITTFDIRMTRPNFEPVMLTGEVHTIEHLAATFLRNHEKYSEQVVYFGPMGCRTGFYLLLGGDYTSKDILPLIIETFEFIRDFTGEIPGATPENCGNYSDMNLDMAKFYAKRFLDEVLYKITEANLFYPN